jgi:pimeloyl-ACP methyl ester carboxylesterase
MIETKIRIVDVDIDIAIHPKISPNIIINLPGFNGSLDGYENKYVKLAEYITSKDLAAVIRMPNTVPRFACRYNTYGIFNVKALKNVIKYAIENSESICGQTNPNIYLIGTSAGGGIVSLVAWMFKEVKKILLVCPANGNSVDYGNAIHDLQLFSGDVSIISGMDDEIIDLYSINQFNVSAQTGFAKNIKLHIVPDCGHNFEGEQNGRILSRAPFWAFADDEDFPEFKESCKLYD